MAFLPLMLALAPALAGAPTDAFRPLDFDAALKAARIEDRPIVVVFGSTTSDDTKKLDTTTWKDPSVRTWLAAKSVAIKQDVELDAELAARFRIHIVPTIVILNRQGVEFDRITGYVDARAFKSSADSILNGADPVERVKKRLAGHETDPDLRIDLAGALADRGLLDQALVEYLWCWDHGLENDATFGAARRGFLLAQIQRLSRLYPAAVDALAQRSASLFEKVTDCSADEDAVADFLALEHVQERDDNVLAAYDAIKSDSPECARTKSRLAPIAIDAMIDARRYTEAVALMGDFESYVDKLATAADMDLKRFEKEHWTLALEARRAKQRTDLARVYEALLGAERYDDADQLARRTLLLDGKGATYVALIHGALRAEAQGSARSIATRAYGDTHLTDAEKLAVKSAARNIIQPH